MFMIPTAEQVSIVEFSQSEKVDFAVRVLMWFGLHVPPFDAHDAGIERLRALDANVDAWQTWFEKLVISEHVGIRVQREGTQSMVDQWRKRLNTVPFIFDGYSEIEASLEVETESILDRYYQSISELYDQPLALTYDVPSVVDNPVDLWEGSEVVRAELMKLWQRYRARPYYRVHHAADLNRRLVRDSMLCERINGLLRDLLDSDGQLLMCHLVNYPSDVFAIVGPSIVIGLSAESAFSTDTFVKLLSEAAIALSSYSC